MPGIHIELDLIWGVHRAGTRPAPILTTKVHDEDVLKCTYIVPYFNIKNF